MYTAAELHNCMLADIRSNYFMRQVSDPDSPNRSATYEALPGTTYSITDSGRNVVPGTDLRWAVANVLHFFASTEKAGILRQYNKHADKFLTGDRFIGAYGPAAVPGIERCISCLNADQHSRRAIVSLGGLDETENYNLPRCINSMHFLVGRSGLDLLVYQRSLSLSVMPYDFVLLSNILHYVAKCTDIPANAIRWTIGSLHTNFLEPRLGASDKNIRLDMLGDPNACWGALHNHSALPEPYKTWMEKETRA